MSNKTDLQHNNIVLGDTPEGVLGGVSKVRNALQNKAVNVEQAGAYPTFNELESAINNNVVNITQTTAQANDVATGKKFFNSNGELTDGSGTIAKELTGFDEIDLPSDFTRANIYSFKSSQGYLFISSSNDATGSRGIYKFNKELKQFEKVLFDSSGYNYQTWFESSDGRIFCTATNYAEAIHWYNEELNEFVKLDMNAATSGGTFTELNNGQICFVGMQAGVCLINKDNSVFRIPNPWQTSFLYYDNFHDEFFFKDTQTSSIYRLNDTKDDVIELTDLGTTQPNFWSSSEDYLFMSIYKTGGQYYFDFSTKQFVSFSSTHGGWSSPWNIVKTSKGYFISSSSSYGALYLYNNGIATIIDETSAKYKWSIFECSNGLIIGGNANNAVLFKYDESSNTMIEISESNSYAKKYTNAYFEYAGYVYFSSNASNNYGTYRFNINTFVFERLSTSSSIQSTYPQSDVGAFFDSHNNLYLLLSIGGSTNSGYIIRVNSGETTFSLITVKNCSCDYITQINDDNLFISSASSANYAARYGSIIYNISTGTQTLVSRLSLYMNNNNFYQYTTGRYYYKLNSTLDALEKVDIEPNFDKFVLVINSTCQSMLYYNKMYSILNGVYASANVRNGYAIDNVNNCILILNEEDSYES